MMLRLLVAALLPFLALCSACTTASLLNAAGGGDTKSVVEILQEGADVNASFPVIGTRALMVAAAQGHVDAVKALLDAGADVNAADLTGWTALHAATYKGDKQIISLLLERGAIAPAPTWFLQRPSDMAEKLGHQDIVPLLKQVEAGNPRISTLP
ncbi:MAG TPA: ankyrin repeat domain-containing protein [Nitrospiraceae bacterium]